MWGEMLRGGTDWGIVDRVMRSNQKVPMGKTRLPRCLRVVGAALFFFVLPSLPAAAYLDPGTGSMILQSIIGILAGALVAIHVFWHRIKSIFTRKRDVESDAKEDHTEQL